MSVQHSFPKLHTTTFSLFESQDIFTSEEQIISGLIVTNMIDIIRLFLSFNAFALSDIKKSHFYR